MNDRPANSKPNLDLLDDLVEEFTARVRAGETPAIADYQARHPELSDDIHELLSSVAMIEGLKKQSTSLTGSGHRPFEDLMQLERLGEYRILRELGRGGMGIVLEAVHESLGRRVAIKVLPNRLVDNEKNIERFTREARAAATLHHNNIVSVFGVGQSDGYYFYVMEYIDGWALDLVMRGMKASTNREPNATVIGETVMLNEENSSSDQTSNVHSDAFQLSSPGLSANHTNQPTNALQLPQGPERFQWAARITSDIADALDYAHKQGVLHRDIKPGNLLLDPAGRVWLTDFGLVKNIANQTMTVAGDIIGTPQYMAPESFEAKYDVASETYCLGATLYEMVTLRPVFEIGSPAEMIRRVTTASPVSPRKIDPRIPNDLSTIIEKAIVREPERRYQTAAELRDDLRAFLEDRPISAKRASIPRRAWLWSKRNPWQTISAMLLGLVAMLAIAGFIARSNSLKMASAQNERLKNEKEKTQKALDESRRNAARFRKQYKRADTNVDIALEMFDEMFKQMVIRGTGNQNNFSFDGFHELSGIETTISEEDAQYLENMLVFFRRFADQNSQNTELISESAKSYRRVANIYHLLGKRDEARTAYRDSIRLFDKLNKSNPDLDSELAQVQTGKEMGLLSLDNGNYKIAVDTFKRVKEEIEKSQWANELPMQLELVRTLNLMGTASPLDTAEALVRERNEDQVRNPSNRRRGFRNRIPKRIIDLGKQNVNFVSEAINRVNLLINEHGPMPELVLERAKSQLRMAELQFIMKRTGESLKSKALAVEDLSGLTNELPESAEYQSVLAQAYAMPIGQDSESAFADLKEALKLADQLCESNPGNSGYLQLSADINYQLGQLNRDLKKNESSIKHYKSALTTMVGVGLLAPRNFQILARTNDLSCELTTILIEQRSFEEARDLLLENLDRLEQSRKAVPRRANQGRGRVGRQYSQLALCYRALGQDKAAKRAEERVKKIRDETRENRPPRRNPGDR